MLPLTYLAALLLPLTTVSGSLTTDTWRRHIEARADAPEAGIGVEIEPAGLKFLNKNEKLEAGTPGSKDLVAKLKGAEIDDGREKEKKNWIISAEVESTDDGRFIKPEMIIDGTKVKLGKGDAKKRVEEINDYLKAWAPGKAKGDTVTVPALSDIGKWAVENPNKFSWALVGELNPAGIQLTMPMPLEGIYDMIENAKNKPNNNKYILSKKRGPYERLHLVTQEQVAAEFKDVKFEEDILGFLSLVLSYVKNTRVQTAGKSAKIITSIMPRTDFVTMYAEMKDRIIDKIKDLDDFKSKGEDDKSRCNYLRKIVEKLGKYDSDGSKDKDSGFKLEEQTFSPYGNLKATDWLNGLDEGEDQLSERDNDLRFGQVGGLKEKKEQVIGGGRAVPIFEFRDLNKYLKDLPDLIEGAEKEAEDLHKKYSKEPAQKMRKRVDLHPVPGLEDPNSSCPSKDRKKDKRCALGEAREWPSGKCKPCPKGQAPTTDQVSCKPIDDKDNKPEKGKCPDGKVLDPAEGKQDKDTDNPICIDDAKCKDGEVATSLDRDDAGKKKQECVKDIDDKDKPRCSEWQYPNVSKDEGGKTKYECQNTRTSDGKDRTSDGNKSSREAANRSPEDRKKARAAFCSKYKAAGMGAAAMRDLLMTTVI